MMAKTNFKTLTHLKINDIDLQDRTVPLFPLYENNEWKMYVLTKDDFIKIKIIDISDGLYFGKQPILRDDLKLIFFNVMLKRANFKEKSKFVFYILDDIQNLSASVEKINLFYIMRKEIDSMILSKYVSTELEYIFKVSRSIYDLLQELITVIWNKFEYIDKTPEKKQFCKNCKTSFNSVIELNNKLSSIDELVNRHKIPYQLAEFYHNHGKFFSWLRAYRDKISHSGQSFNIFVGDEGFSLSIENNHFNNLHFWNEKNVLENNLGSVKSLTAYIVLNTIQGLEEFAKTINTIMILPDDIAPEYNIYLRSKFNKTLKELHKYDDEMAWEI